MKISAFFSAFALTLGLATSAEATIYDCEMNGNIKVNGATMDVRLTIDVAYWGYGKVKTGSYSYSLTDGRTGKGQLDCTHSNPRFEGEQTCLPTPKDPIIETIPILKKWGVTVQVYGQDPIGLVDCNAR